MGETVKRTRVRYLILAILFVVTAINYIDRSALSIAAPVMKEDLALDAVALGFAFSAFNWAYTFMQIPSGWLLDRFGTRLVYGIGLFTWSLFTGLQGLVTGFAMLFLFRFIVGLAEAPSFPGNSRLTTMWFPTNERGKAVATYNSSQYFGLALFTPVLASLLNVYGWPAIFYVAGGMGIILTFVWFKLIHDPKRHPLANQKELEYIEQGGALVDASEQKSPIKWSHARLLLTNRQMIGIYIAQFSLNTIVWFFLTWLPTYLVQEKHLSILKAGFVTSLTYAAAFLGGILAGYWSDSMLKRGKSLAVARKTPIIIGFLLSSCILLANYTNSPALIVLILCVSFFAKGMAGLTWTLVGDMSPKEIIGLSAGIFNTSGNLAGIVTPIVVGFILEHTHSFSYALLFIGVVLLIGALSYMFIVNKVERLQLPHEQGQTAKSVNA
ncbi:MULTISPECIES: MFS transporter [Geobacillus]|uniref:MFS transporter n=1 Tax=Geobacillus thermocatenulatus TaxID=33938 RepID=A0A226Q374_9BACL|nr:MULTISPECIES: MFS transporter [Geobacillus]ASS99735.1 MFS transporter [Geobacillus thermocatenulatus]KLR72803.1 glucarate transporter [Geobacillus sp. T6]OXB86140.1 MFS transporter [Geobacillus thermocatenulatus]RAN23311.1 glucarate transporter [Geobacillus sp. A8]